MLFLINKNFFKNIRDFASLFADLAHLPNPETYLKKLHLKSFCDQIMSKKSKIGFRVKHQKVKKRLNH